VPCGLRPSGLFTAIPSSQPRSIATLPTLLKVNHATTAKESLFEKMNLKDNENNFS
jgi:hypothetical protein